MPFYDLPLDQLRMYMPPRNEPDDFDSFWNDTLASARQHPLNATFKPVDYGLRLIETWDVTYSGYGGQPIKGWLLLPRERSGKLPCVVEYIGYGGGRGFPLEWLTWSSMGYAHLVMDTRGQGSAWRAGDTPDNDAEGNQSAAVPRLYDARHPRRQDLLLSPGVHRCGARRRGGPQPCGRRCEAHRGHRRQPGRRHHARRGGHSCQTWPPPCPTCRILCHYRRATTLIDTAPYNEISRYLQDPPRPC